MYSFCCGTQKFGHGQERGQTFFDYNFLSFTTFTTFHENYCCLFPVSPTYTSIYWSNLIPVIVYVEFTFVKKWRFVLLSKIVLPNSTVHITAKVHSMKALLW